MNHQVVHDAMKLKHSDFLMVQEEIGILYHQGVHETELDFRKRVLQEVEKSGKMRDLEQLLN